MTEKDKFWSDEGLCELIEESRKRMHQMIDRKYDELLGYAQKDNKIYEPRKLSLAVPPSIFKGEKPLEITFASGEKISANTWKKVAVSILSECNKNPIMHEKLMDIRGSVAGRTRFILSKSSVDMDVPLKIDEDLYFEGKFDSEYLIKMLTTRILKPIGFDYNNISVTLRQREPDISVNIEESDAFTGENIEDSEDTEDINQGITPSM